MSEMTMEDLRKAQVAEYGKYVAKEPIHINGVRAFNTGDPVPVGHVTSGVVDKSQVVGVNTQAAKAATGQEG